MNGRGGKKRHSSQPLGGDAKDARSETERCLEAGDLTTWSQVTAKGRAGPLATSNRFDQLTLPNSYPDRSMRSASVSSRGSRGSRRNSTVIHNRENVREERSQINQDDGTPNPELEYSQSSLGPESRFVTPKPDGAFRDDFAVEFQQLNGKPFRGSITIKEARDIVFKEILGFNPRLLHSIRPVFGGAVTIRFKLKEQINLDNLTTVEFFDLERKVSPTRTDTISCRIMGIRGLQAEPNYDGTSNDIRWIKIENCEYSIEKDDIVEWLKLYGQPLSLLAEDLLPDSDSEAGPLGNGTYSLKMKLERDIPQFLPMHGRKIRVYFKNMNKLCSNCYGHHTRRQCTNEKVPWIVYVRDFMKANPDITENFYGKWWDVVDTEFPGYFDQDEDEGGNQCPDQSQTTSNQTLPQQATSGTQAGVATSNTNVLPQIQSRDPRVQRQQKRHQQQPTDHEELTMLMQRGLTITDAKNYLKNKREQEDIEKRMLDPGTSSRDNTRETGPSFRNTGSSGNRSSTTRLGPGAGPSGGRGGLSFN